MLTGNGCHALILSIFFLIGKKAVGVSVEGPIGAHAGAPESRFRPVSHLLKDHLPEGTKDGFFTMHTCFLVVYSILLPSH